MRRRLDVAEGPLKLTCSLAAVVSHPVGVSVVGALLVGTRVGGAVGKLDGIDVGNSDGVGVGPWVGASVVVGKCIKVVIHDFDSKLMKVLTSCAYP